MPPDCRLLVEVAVRPPLRHRNTHSPSRGLGLDLHKPEQPELEVRLRHRRGEILMPRVGNDIPASVAVEEIDARRFFVVSSDGDRREVGDLRSAHYVTRLPCRLRSWEAGELQNARAVQRLRRRLHRATSLPTALASFR